MPIDEKTNISCLFGGVSISREPNCDLVSFLEDQLERARSGEIIGIAAAFMYWDNTSTASMVGRVGGYSMIGAVEIIKSDLVDVARGG